jgi:hypothetical protein
MQPTAATIAKAIHAHIAALQQPGVLSARPGFRVKDGWLTATPAIVVTVEKKAQPSAAENVLPREIDGIPVDVRQASAAKYARVTDPEGYAARFGPYPDAGAVPEFRSELKLTSEPTARLLGLVPELAKPSKPNLPYVPADVPLAAFDGETTIELCASPDSGWPTLKAFLQGTKRTLTVGMYDWTSQHILDTAEATLKGEKLNLVLDHPALNPTADHPDETTVNDLRAKLGNDLDQAWALERMDPLATAWTFPTAYHIKVAVRDQESFWLSSGNWNNSNQPEIDPVHNPGEAAAATSGDRDWHVIVSEPGLAKVFEAYLLNDLAIAAQHNQPPSASAAALQPVLLPMAQTPPFHHFFSAQTITGQMRLTPLLTPDPGVYVKAVLALIAGAQKTLHLQFQYIELPKTASPATTPFAELVQAVIDRQHAGVEVEIVMSEYETAGYLEQLQAAGLDVVNSVKIQNNVHNKGVIVDGTRVLVSSQNWSGDGVLLNRDAGLLIENVDAAAYFEQIFQHDWQYLAAPKVLND